MGPQAQAPYPPLMPGNERNIVYAQLACSHVVNLFDHPCRHLHGAWQEWRRAGSRANDPHALVAEQLEALGPAKFCPACAGTPDSAGSWPALRLLLVTCNIASRLNSTVFSCSLLNPQPVQVLQHQPRPRGFLSTPQHISLVTPQAVSHASCCTL